MLCISAICRIHHRQDWEIKLHTKFGMVGNQMLPIYCKVCHTAACRRCLHMGVLADADSIPAVKASMGLDSMTCTKSELVASTLKE